MILHIRLIVRYQIPTNKTLLIGNAASRKVFEQLIGVNFSYNILKNIPKNALKMRLSPVYIM